MMTTKRLLSLLILIMLVVPVSAITYSKEYYLWGNTSLDNFGYVSTNVPSNGLVSHDYAAQYLLSAQWFELRRQTILMEKQNELLEERNNLTRQQMGMKLRCTQNGLAMYGGCLEYAWV